MGWGPRLVQPPPVQGLVRSGSCTSFPRTSGCPVPAGFPSRAGPHGGRGGGRCEHRQVCTWVHQCTGACSCPAQLLQGWCPALPTALGHGGLLGFLLCRHSFTGRWGSPFCLLLGWGLLLPCSRSVGCVCESTQLHLCLLGGCSSCVCSSPALMRGVAEWL